MDTITAPLGAELNTLCLGATPSPALNAPSAPINVV